LTPHGRVNGFGPGGARFFHSGITMDIELFNTVKDIVIPAAAILVPLFVGYIATKVQSRQDIKLRNEIDRIQKIEDITTDYIIHANKSYCYTFNKMIFESSLEKSEMNPAIAREKNLIELMNKFNDEFVFVKEAFDVGRIWEKSNEIVNLINSYIYNNDKIKKAG
jgi:hypothetical protein